MKATKNHFLKADATFKNSSLGLQHVINYSGTINQLKRSDHRLIGQLLCLDWKPENVKILAWITIKEFFSSNFFLSWGEKCCKALLSHSWGVD